MNWQPKRTDPSRWLRQVIPKWPLLGLLIVATVLSGLLLESAGLVGVWPNQVLAALAFQTQQPLPDKFLFTIGAQAPVEQFDYPQSVAVAPDGTVYVGEGSRIQCFSATGAFLRTWGSPGTGEGQFWGLGGLAVAPDGSVYIADSGNNRVQYFTASNTFIRSLGISSPAGVSLAPDGTLYVAEWSNSLIRHISATGQFLGILCPAGSSDGQCSYAAGVAVASNGVVYVADTGNHRIQRFSADGAFLGKWGSQGSGDDQFNQPAGVAVAPDGTVYIADRWNHRIQRFSATGQFLEKWGSYGSGDRQFNAPRGVTVAPDGTVYVADVNNHRIQRFSATGQFLGKWGSYGNSDGQLNHLDDIAIAGDGSIYVTDKWNNRIQHLSGTGLFLGKWGSPGSGNGQFSDPNGLGVAPNGTVCVADRGNHRIQCFTADGTFSRKWGSYGSGDGQFNNPRDVAIAPDGTVYVADHYNHRIQYFTASGTFLDKWGTQGSGDGQFNTPAGVAVAADGTVYVTDPGNNRVQRFTASGQFLGKWGSQGSGDGQFNGPWGIAVASDGTVYVTDWLNFRVQRFTSAGTFLGKWGWWSHREGAFAWPVGVAVTSDGTAYVSEFDTSRIQAFGPWYHTTWRGEYFANRWLAEAPVLIRQDTAIDFEWGGDSPGPEVPAESFSARWYRYVWFEEGSYVFNVYVDDGVRLWVDEQLLVDQWWHPQISTYTAEVYLSQGYHKVQMEYYEGWGAASVRLSWQAWSPDSHEPDDTCDQARLITVNGSAQTHNFHTGSDVDWVKFAVSASNIYEIRTSNLGVNSDTVLELYDDTCNNLLASNDDYEGLASRITWLASNSTTWHVKVRPYSETRTGSDSNYDLSVTATPRSPDGYEPDDTCAQARSIPINGSAQTHNLDWAGDVDWVKFTATAGTWYEILTYNLGSNADTVLELYDTGCGDILAANDGYTSDWRPSRIVWVAPASSIYYVKVRPYSSYRTGSGSNYDLTVATTTPHGIPLQVRNQAGDPATTCFWAEAYTGGATSPVFRDTCGRSGYSFLDVSNGTYTLVTGSGNDHFLLVRPNVVAPSTLTLDTGGTAAVDVYAYQRDGSPLEDWTSVYLRPYYGSYGWVGRPDGNGYLHVDAATGNYNAFVWSWDYLYYLVRPNVGIWSPTTLNFDARTMPTGQVNVSLNGMDLAGLAPWGSYTSWAPSLTVYNGDAIVLSPDSYDVTGYLRKYTAEEGYWYYGFSAPEPLDVTAGGTTTFRGGGTFSASTGSEQPQYRPGQVVTIINTFQDASANRLTWVEVYTSNSAAGAGAAKEEGREIPAVFLESEEVMERGQGRMIVQQRDVDVGPSPDTNVRPSRPELSGAGWNYIYPVTTVRAPNGQVVFQDNTWRGFSTINFTLPAPVMEGIYSIASSLDTGPHQGVIQATSSFQVKLARVYLSLLLKSPYVPPPTVRNGDFETGTFSPYWVQGGELTSSVVEWLDVGEPNPTFEPPYAGHYSALLGDPDLGVGWPNPIPAGSAWIQQQIPVPNTGSPRLTFWYRVMSYDVMQGVRLWDTFDVTINDTTNVVWRDGPDRPIGFQGIRYDSDWKSGLVDLGPWRGQEIVIRFAIWNRDYEGDGVDYYNTWAYLDEVHVEP